MGHARPQRWRVRAVSHTFEIRILMASSTVPLSC
jgi:hypothetical protein